ncbi:MAG: DUF2089 family protein [Tepidisphaeraceae bacterium]
MDDEDVAFIKRFVLASGSLKDLAGTYDISYPTIRLRLDRLIAKIKVLDDPRSMGIFERTLRAQFAEGKIDAATLKTLLSAHEKEWESAHDPSDNSPGVRAASAQRRRATGG